MTERKLPKCAATTAEGKRCSLAGKFSIARGFALCQRHYDQEKAKG